MSEPWLVAGLGNPGDRYASTRHNAGRMVVEEICRRLGVRLRKVRFVAAEAAEAAEGRQGEAALVLVSATAFMNVSGPPIVSVARKRDIPVDRVIACHDDLDLSFGALRVKRGGSTAGHHGLDSLVAAFRSPDFYRVRIGIGRPPGRQDPMDFVLEPFAREERESAAVVIQDAADAALSLITNGLRVTQDRYNRGGVREG